MKKTEKISVSPFYAKLILTIGLLICVPMLIVQILLFFSSYKALNEQNSRYYYLRSQSLSSRFYSQLTGFREITVKMSGNAYKGSSKKFLTMRDNYTSMMLQVSEELSQIQFGLPLAQEVGIYYPERNIVLNEKWYYTFDNFCNSFSGGNAYVAQKVRSALSGPYTSSGRIVSSLPAGPLKSGDVAQNALLFAFPVKLNNYSEYDAVIYFVISHSSIDTVLSGNAQSENYTYAIFNEDSDLLFTSNTENAGEFLGESFVEYLSDPVQIIYNFSDGATRAYKWKDTTNSNIFITIVGESRLEENNKAFLHRMGILLGINVVMLIALLALTAYINYSPLRRLVTRISPGNSEKNMSEFEQIEQVIQELDNRASDQGVVIMDYVLNDLLYGKITRQPELEQLIPNFHFRYFCAVSVVCSHPTFDQAQQIAELAERKCGCRIYITDIPNKDCSLFVCLSKDLLDPEKLSAAISGAVYNVMDELCTVFPGTVVEKLDEISASYYSSQAKMGDKSPVRTQNYPTAQLNLLESQIVSSRFQQAEAAIDGISDYLKQNCHDRALCRYLCYEELQVFLDARGKTAVPVEQEELQELLHFKDGEHLTQMMKNSLHTLSEAPAAADPGARQQRELADYVDENFCQPGISLVTVADRFGISIYMVSRLFKNQTGAGFKEYINAKRLERACSLLTETEDSISSIAQQVGFENPTYFTSLFRTRYGMTPSKYREDARENG